MKARPFLFAILASGLAALVALLAIVPSSSRAAHVPLPHDSIRVWRDPSNDLWIATPFYLWNITGGTSVTVVTGDGTYEWRPGMHSPGDRVIDALFISPQPAGHATSRVIFAVPDEALVYLERESAGGTEGLELAFRVSDGLVRVTHRWQGERAWAGAPTLRVNLAPADGRAVREITGTLRVAARALSPAAYDYSGSFDPAARQGYAWLTPREGPEQAARPPTSGQGPSGASTATRCDTCELPTLFLPGEVVGRRFLLFYSADPAAPLRPIQKLVARLGAGAADLNAASIARLPRYDYDAAKNTPAAGDEKTFVARVANRGTESTGVFTYTWSIDDTAVLSGTHPSLDPGDLITLPLTWTWQTGAHTVTVALDPEDLLFELSEQNNVVADRTDALAIGLWVEQSVYDYFNAHQSGLGLGSVSWDDWAQRQLRVWNQMFADAVHPLTPQGILDRVRLDKVTVVPDGSLPLCATNFPDTSDRTIDLQWGFPAELVGIDTGHTCGELNYYFNHPESQDIEYSLMHELSHARYLIDLYGLNVYVNSAQLSEAVDSITSTLRVDRDVAADGNFPLPAYLAMEGELVICQSKTGTSFLECARGAEGTTPRPHDTGARVTLATVRLQDGQGNLVQGSPALPLIGTWLDHLYLQRFPDDLMGGGLSYEQHSAYAWNRIAGQRPVCGNYNAPCNIGEYLNDLPDHHVLEIHDKHGGPLPGVRVEVYQARAIYPIWYGKVYTGTPDTVYDTDPQGRADLGAFPFGDGPPVKHRYGHSNGVILLKLSLSGQTEYDFLEVTLANEAYWSGDQDTAVFIIDTELTRRVFLPLVSTRQITPPIAGFASTSPGWTGEVISFTNTTTGTEPIDYAWDFGNGTASTDVHPTHVYSDAGEYTVVLTATNLGGSSVYSDGVVIHGDYWLAEFWNNETLSGDPDVVRHEAEIDFEWFDGPPDPLIGSNHFSSRWTRTLHFDAGNYRFHLFHDDGVRLWIDGELHVVEWHRARGIEIVEMPLSGGLHTIALEHYEIDGWASLRFSWERLAGECDPAGNGIVLYELPNYGGRCLSFYDDGYDLKLIDLNDVVSSVRFRGDTAGLYVVTLHEHPHFGGDALVLSSSRSDLGGASFDNMASSVRVRPRIDAFEVDDVCSSASTLSTDGTTQRHTFDAADPADWATFQAVAGYTYTIHTLNLGPIADTMLRLYRSDCTTQIAFDDDGGEGLASLISWPADETGPVAVKVLSYAGRKGPGHFYDLRVAPAITGLLELRFEGSFVGEEGEQGTAVGPTFAPGHSGVGARFDDADTVRYATEDNIDRALGSIAFWLKPSWDGDDGQDHVFFDVGDTTYNRMRVMKDGANNLRFLVWSPDTEYDVSTSVASWQANEWHHVRTTWLTDTIQLYLDGTLRDTEFPIVLPDALPSEMVIGASTDAGMQAYAVIDDFIISAQP